MSFPPQKFREIVFQLLFSFDANGQAEEGLIPFLMSELSVSKKNVKMAYEKAIEIWKNKDVLDQAIKERSTEYSLDRIKTVEKNVLRLALYDLLIEKGQNRKIVISEAHRLTRKFSTVEGASFVNAVLDDSQDKNNESPLSPSEAEISQ